MRYIDSGKRDPGEAPGTWLLSALDDEIAELRWQTGFFSSEPLGLLAPTLDRLARANRVVTAVVGSNDGATLSDDVRQLVERIGLPRHRARVGVVSYSGAWRIQSVVATPHERRLR